MAEEIKIEKGIPMPEFSVSKYPWDDMDVGDSFAVPLGTRQNVHQLTVYQNAKRAPKRFKAAVRRGVGRIWRTA